MISLFPEHTNSNKTDARFFFHNKRKMGINRKHYGTISLALSEGSVCVEIIK